MSKTLFYQTELCFKENFKKCFYVKIVKTVPVEAVRKVNRLN